MTKLVYIFIQGIIFLLIPILCAGQQIPLYNNYFINPAIYNPSYVGYDNAPMLHVNYRQWSGFDGGPRTGTLSFNTPFADRMGVGAHYSYDQAGIFTNNSLLGAYKYKLPISDVQSINFGLSAGILAQIVDTENINLSDPVLNDIAQNQIYMHGQLGLSYQSENLLIGINLPKAFKSHLDSNFVSVEEPPLFMGNITTSFELTPGKVYFKPTILATFKQNSPIVNLEGAGIFHFQDIGWVGGSYRYNGGISLLLGFDYQDRLQLAYAFERFSVHEIRNSEGSHEIHVSVRIGPHRKPKKKPIENTISTNTNIKEDELYGNKDPKVIKVIRDQELEVNQSINLNITPNFNDPDGDDLTFKASLANDNPLPSWLSFKANKFNGTPREGDERIYYVKVTAEDGNGGSVSDVFELNVMKESEETLPANRPPVLVTAISDQSLEVDQAINLAISDNFSDPDGDPLSYRATLSNNTSLPSWLQFNNGRFTGTSTTAVTNTVKVTADDGKGGTKSTLFVISIEEPEVVTPANQPPVVQAIPDQEVTVGDAYRYDATNNFSDPDGDPLQFRATLANNTPLPSWLSFNNGIFTGTPADNNRATLSIRVAANDADGETISDEFTINVVARPVVNQPPVAQAIPDQEVTAGDNFRFMASSSFSDPDGDPLQYSAALSNDDPLPTWLTFSNGAFTGIPSNNDVANLSIKVTAQDGKGEQISSNFNLLVKEKPVVNQPPTLAADIPDQDIYSGDALNLSILSNFNDPDGDPLSYTATLADTSPLPDWLSFSNGTFTGTPGDDNEGSITVQVTATDNKGLNASSMFKINIIKKATPPTQVESKNLEDMSISELSEGVKIIEVDEGTAPTDLGANNYVIVGAFGVYSNAKKFSDELNAEGYVAKFGYITEKNFYYVYIYNNSSLKRALVAKKRMQEKITENPLFKDTWILVVKKRESDQDDDAKFDDIEGSSKASSEDQVDDLPADVRIVADQMPAPKKGMQKYLKGLTSKINYPNEALRKRIQGTVLVRVIIDEEGNITSPKVMPGKGLGNGCDEEAIRVIQKSGKWNAGSNNGKPVKVQQVIPVVFKLPESPGRY